MTFNDNYILRNIAGETLLVRQGADGVDMTRVIALNASGAFLFHKLSNSNFTTDDAAVLLAKEYHISAEKAGKDAADWIKTLAGYGAICE